MRAALITAFGEPLEVTEVANPVVPEQRGDSPGGGDRSVPQRLARLDGPRAAARAASHTGARDGGDGGRGWDGESNAGESATG